MKKKISICSIYVITNIYNKKVYIGQTWKSLKTRFSVHCQPSTTSHCLKLRRAIDKYGKENFIIELLATCSSQQDADELESNYIIKYDSIKHGYNILKYAFSRKGIKHTKKTKRKMSKVHSGENNANSKLTQDIVIKIRQDYFEYVNPKTGSKYGIITQLSKKYNIGTSAIFDVVKGNRWK